MKTTISKLTNKSFMEQVGMHLKEQYEFTEDRASNGCDGIELTFLDVDKATVREIADKYNLVKIFGWNDGEIAYAVNEFSAKHQDEVIGYDIEGKSLMIFGWSTTGEQL